jgi:uncharacterized Rossmann fold enzyme
VELDVWLPVYSRILDEFGFSEADDIRSARLLSRILGDRDQGSLRQLRNRFPRAVTICGGSDSLGNEISLLEPGGFIVAADSAATVLADAGFGPDIIVTDLDGRVEDQLECSRRGSFVFVHAHGDNMPALERYAGRFLGPVVGTCQCEPVPGVVNFGGFTDGDRAACICAQLGATKILLCGFDFEKPGTKSGKQSGIKLRKLRWARHILQILQDGGIDVRMASGDEVPALC